jgi:Na+-driven multidrug efflux pump
MLMMGLVGAVMVFFPDVLLGFFVNDPAAVAAGTAPLRAAGIVQPALAVGFILNGALRGAGDTRWPLLTRLMTTWGIRLPMTLLLVGWLGLGLNAIWLAMCTDFTAQAMLALWRFGSGRWQRVEV